jgi:hypothetical protein
MSINLSLIFQHPVAVSHFVQYARIDNVNTPVFTTVVPNPITSPAIIATNVPAGQYQINSTPVYADGRKCDPTVFTTPGCDPLTAISARINSGNIIVSYSAPSTAPKVRITVSFPNGGSSVANYVNDGNDIVIPIPAGLIGQFLIQGQSVCDESTGFYSGLSSTVSVNIFQPVAGSYRAGVSSSTVCNLGPQTFYTNGPFIQGITLFTDNALSNPAVGYNFIVFNDTIYAVDPITGIVGAATGSSCTGAATLTFRFINSGGFLNFQATLNTAIDGVVTISRMFADGFPTSDCSGGANASAQKNTNMVIGIGQLGNNSSPDPTPPPTGTWNAATNNKIYNVIVNGSSVVNGTPVTIGSYLVTMIIPSCE